MAVYTTGNPSTAYTTESPSTDFITNNSQNGSTLAPPLCTSSETNSLQLKAFKVIIYSVVMLVAFTGNIFIIAVVYKKKRMRRTTNIFIANMAVSDMFCSLVIIPRTLAQLYTGSGRWMLSGIFGTITCKFCFFVGDFSVFISIACHTVIAVDRFWAIVHSLKPSPITPSRRKYIIALIWLFNVFLLSPNLYTLQLHYKNGEPYCVSNWYPLNPLKASRTFYVILFVIGVVIPVSLMLSLYTRLVISLRCGQNVSAIHTSQVRKQRKKENIAVLRKVVIMVAVFLISLIPLHTLAILYFFVWDGSIPCYPHVRDFAVSAHFLLLSNTAVNPCICIILSKSYRRQITKTFAWKYIMNVTSSMNSTVRNEECINGVEAGFRVESTSENNDKSSNKSSKRIVEFLPLSIRKIYFNGHSSQHNS